jgi:hypothetical protein
MMLDKSKKRKTKVDVNYLPRSAALGFETALDSLVLELSVTEGFKGRYLLSEYKSKYSGEGTATAEERRTAAVHKWIAADERNSITNQRLQLGDVDLGWTTSDILIDKARGIIKSILGPLVYPDVLTDIQHSNGASTRVGRSPMASILKHGGIAHVSSSCVKHWLRVASCTQLSDQVIVPQEHSVLFTVPKNTEIDRPACKEPEINMLLQRSAGKYIRSRLRKKTGINLLDQSRNQELAKTAVKAGLATIDLSAASDSITKQLVFELLPFDWWSLLDDIRVHETLVDGEIRQLEMFSSMGNGFTFELESLIFYALSRAICWLSGTKGTISVYGDDIIVPVAIARRLARTFSWFGFTVNSKKSAWSGNFRESCGRHYYGGVEVTPFYLREPVRQKTDVIRVLNRLLIWESRDLRCLLHPAIIDFHKKWARLIPEKLHGGIDPEDITSLVTGDRKRSRLHQVIKKHDYPQSLALIYWLTSRSTSNAEGGPFLDFSLEVSVTSEGRWKIVPHSPWAVDTAWTPYLLDEV